MQIDHEKLKQVREEKGIKCIELAIATGLGENRMQQIERGKAKRLNINIVKAIARKLGCKLEEIVK